MLTVAMHIARKLDSERTLPTAPPPPPLQASNPRAVARSLLEEWVRRTGPSGSGFDEGTRLLGKSTSDRLAFRCPFHHMDDQGFYSRWTSHVVIVKPSLAYGLDIHVTGPDFNQIKDYIHETFRCWLDQEVTLLFDGKETKALLSWEAALLTKEALHV